MRVDKMTWFCIGVTICTAITVALLWYFVNFPSALLVFVAVVLTAMIVKMVLFFKTTPETNYVEPAPIYRPKDTAAVGVEVVDMEPSTLETLLPPRPPNYFMTKRGSKYNEPRSWPVEQLLLKSRRERLQEQGKRREQQRERQQREEEERQKELDERYAWHHRRLEELQELEDQLLEMRNLNQELLFLYGLRPDQPAPNQPRPDLHIPFLPAILQPRPQRPTVIPTIQVDPPSDQSDGRPSTPKPAQPETPSEPASAVQHTQAAHSTQNDLPAQTSRPNRPVRPSQLELVHTTQEAHAAFAASAADVSEASPASQPAQCVQSPHPSRRNVPTDLDQVAAGQAGLAAAAAAQPSQPGQLQLPRRTRRNMRTDQGRVQAGRAAHAASAAQAVHPSAADAAVAADDALGAAAQQQVTDLDAEEEEEEAGCAGSYVAEV